MSQPTMRGGAPAARRPHKPETEGSIPSPATKLVQGTIYALTVRRERGTTQQYIGRYLGARNGGHVFTLEGGVRLKVDEWSLTESRAIAEVPA